MRTGKILYTELIYNRSVLIFITAATLLNLLVLKNWEWLSGQRPEQPDFGFIVIGYLLYVFLFTLIVSPDHKESRTSQHLMLPVSPAQVAAAQVLRFVIYWICLILLLYMLALIVDLDVWSALQLPVILSVSGLAFSILALIFITREFSFLLPSDDKHRIKKTIAKLLFYVIIGALLILWSAASIDVYQASSMDLPARLIQKVYFNPAAAVILFVWGVLMLFVRIILFKRRNSYL